MFFDNVPVPQRNRIGQEGVGFMMQMLQFQEERLFGAANMIKGLEVMKIEHPLKAGVAGVVRRLRVVHGDQVKNRQILLEVE